MPVKKLHSLSIFFPCYNEAQNIPLFVKEALRVLPNLAKKFEIIIVNDGSTDTTAEVAKAMVELNPLIIRVIQHDKNRGYGAALKSGISAAKLDWVFFTDGDLQFDLKQLELLIPHTQKFKVVIGYRIKRAEGNFRAFNARLFKAFVDLLFRVHVRDLDCAFKLFDRKLIQTFDLDSDGAFISAEILYRLKKYRVPHFQVPVKHKKRRFGSPSGNNLKVIIKAGLDALRLYFHMKFGTAL